MKLTELEKHQLQVAKQNATSVLEKIKQKHLKEKDLEAMKILEEAVTGLEFMTLQ